MPVIKSAQKRVRQEAKRRARNRSFKDDLRRLTKELQAAIDAKDTKKMNGLLPKMQSKLDTAVKKNQIPANTAKRRMSRIAQQAKAAGAKPATNKSTPTKKATTKKPAAKKSAAKKPAAKKSAPKKAATKKTTAKKSS